jgi:hypothetical protein
MASVTSLDQDMRKLRMDRVTPQAENEVRNFIRASLKTEPEIAVRNKKIDNELLERLERESLFDFLSDGVGLCRHSFPFIWS